MKEIRFIRIIRRKNVTANENLIVGELGELNEWRCGVELRTPNGEGELLKHE